MSIPVIGTPIVNGFHWLKRLVDSVDYPVDTFVIINNNGKGGLTVELDNLVKMEHPFIKKLVVCHLPSNIGVSGAWNMIIKCYMNSPYWIIANNDIAFTPGFLEEMNLAASDNEVGMVHGNAGDFDFGSYDLFLIKDWVIKQYGLFDENFYPAYCEDLDYIMRLVHKPIKSIKNISKPYYHGETFNYSETGKQTSRVDPELGDRLNYVHMVNFRYMDEKWGPHWRTTWPYELPYNKSDLPITYTSFDLEYVRSKNLGF